MATQTVTFSAAAGQTVTAKLFPRGSDTQTASVSATAATNRAGVYTADYTDVAAGVYQLIAVNDAGTKLAEWWVTLTLTTATFQAYEVPEQSSSSGDATLAKQTEILAAIQGSAVIQVASPNVQGNLVLTQGDDYDGTANPKASWTVTTDYTDGWSVTLTVRDVDDAVIYTTTGEVVSSTVVAVTIAAPTGLTMTGCPGQWQGKFDVQMTKAGKKKTIALGVCYINEDQTR